VPLENVPVAPLDATARKVTVTPLIGFENASTTIACNGFANAVLTIAYCEDPLLASTAPAAPTVFVREKLAPVVTPDTVATTVYVPMAVAAVNAGEVATPLEFVVAVAIGPAA